MYIYWCRMWCYFYIVLGLKLFKKLEYEKLLIKFKGVILNWFDVYFLKYLFMFGKYYGLCLYEFRLCNFVYSFGI